MPRELLILRHAKSDWSTGASSDFERPLADRGRNDAPLMGAWMHKMGLIPRHVVSSPAERARETSVLVCKALDIRKKDISWDTRIYAADVSELLGALADCPGDASSVLIVGHNPGLEDLVVHLVADDLEIPDDGKLLPTAALARLEMPDDWSRLGRGVARLSSITRPRDLKD